MPLLALGHKMALSLLTLMLGSALDTKPRGRIEYLKAFPVNLRDSFFDSAKTVAVTLRLATAASQIAFARLLRCDVCCV